jgi:hypothetical protein
MVLDSYKFTVTATAEGGATFTSNELTLQTVCGPASFVDVWPRFVTNNGDAQTVEAGSAISTRFLVDELPNSALNTPCQVTNVMYETFWDSGVAHPSLETPTAVTPYTGSLSAY